jgi:hypothetical protein
MNITVGPANVFTQVDFLKSNKYNVHFIDSCNNCRYFDQFKDTAFSGKCEKRPAFIADVLHICEKFVTGAERLKIIHPETVKELIEN